MKPTSIRQAIKSRQQTLLTNLAQDFDIEGINKSPARFNLKKLQDINSRFIRMMSLEEFVLRSFMIQLGIGLNDELVVTSESPYPFQREAALEKGQEIIEPEHQIITQYCAWSLDKNRVITLKEFGNESSCILDWQPPLIEDVKWRKSSLQESLSNLIEIRDFVLEIYDQNPHRFPEKIDQVEHYMKESSVWWEEQIKQWLEARNYQMGDYLWPLRVSLSGQAKSPSPFEILSIISKEEAHRRINTVYNSAQP